MKPELALLIAMSFLMTSGSGFAQDAREAPSPRECVPADSSTVEGKLAGYVVHAQSEDVMPAAAITLEWTPKEAGASGSNPVATTTTDGEGRYWFCDVPPGARLTLRAKGPAGGTATVSLVMQEGFQRNDLTLHHGSKGDDADLAILILDVETERPVEGAIVRIPDADRVVVADEHGRASIEDLPAGSYEFQVQHIAYGEQGDTLRVRGGHAHLVTIYLTPRPFVMEPLQVTVQYRPRWLVDTGFYRRKEMGLGYHVSPEEIERRNPSRLSHLLEPAPNVWLVRECDPYCTTLLRTASTRTRACSPEIYMDGKKLRLPALFSLDDVPVSDIAAIEMYTRISQTPPQFYGLCGSLVIWTKRFEA